MKVHEIIDARSQGWQLRETEGGLRKGLLIRRERFGISASHLSCQNAIKTPPTPHPTKGDSHVLNFSGVSVLLFIFILNSDEATITAHWLGGF